MKALYLVVAKFFVCKFEETTLAKIDHFQIGINHILLKLTRVAFKLLK